MAKAVNRELNDVGISCKRADEAGSSMVGNKPSPRSSSTLERNRSVRINPLEIVFA